VPALAKLCTVEWTNPVKIIMMIGDLHCRATLLKCILLLASV